MVAGRCDGGRRDSGVMQGCLHAHPTCCQAGSPSLDELQWQVCVWGDRGRAPCMRAAWASNSDPLVHSLWQQA